MLISLFSLAAAGPLEDVARIELQNARELHRAIRTADVSERYKLSESCAKTQEKTQGAIDEARAAFDGKDHKAAYLKIHEALMGLKPCALELASGPKPYQDKLKAMMRTSDEQLVALDAHLAEHGTETSKAAYGEAVAAKTTSRSKGIADQVSGATEDWFTMLEAIGTAIKGSS